MDYSSHNRKQPTSKNCFIISRLRRDLGLAKATMPRMVSQSLGKPQSEMTERYMKNQQGRKLGIPALRDGALQCFTGARNAGDLEVNQCVRPGWVGKSTRRANSLEEELIDWVRSIYCRLVICFWQGSARWPKLAIPSCLFRPWPVFAFCCCRKCHIYCMESLATII